MHLRPRVYQIGVSPIWVVFIQAILLSWGSAFAAERNVSDRVLFHYQNNPYTVHDLTGVTFAEMTNAVDRIKRKYEMGKYKPSTGSYLSPALSPWKSDNPSDLAGYVEHSLNGVVEIFCRAKVFELFKERFPAVVTNYYNSAMVTPALLQYGNLSERKFDEYEKLPVTISQSDFVARMSSLFPASHTSVWQQVYRSWSPQAPFFATNGECFPRMRAGRVAPWLEQLYSAALVSYHIEAEIEAHKDKYIQILESEFGKVGYFDVQNATKADLDQLTNVFISVTGTNASVVGGAIPKMMQTLRELQSSIRIIQDKGSYPTIGSKYKISRENLKPAEFIEYGQGSNKSQSYVYIYQTTITPRFSSYSSEPGNFLYDSAARYLLRPLFDEVLQQMRLSSNITLRPEPVLIDSAFGRRYLPKEMVGEKIPDFIIDRKR